ncbi:MAG: hypothetical protein RQ801_00365 [Spirochaetaceae bacterium]|nr:hypothetical protein [Spirochaetaceae bacterium]MDT8296721.1 hypothetical protein [Spirochaetaceae bacterium]
MKRTATSGLLAVIFVFAALLSGCKGVGIFASIAVSEKIIDGSLPDGVRASEVFTLTADLSDDATVNPIVYGYFSTGPRLFRKSGIDTGASWSAVSLPDGFEVVQSIAGSNNNVILLALSKGYGSSYHTALYYFWVDTTPTDPAPDVMHFDKVTNGDFYGDDSGYQTIGLFYPDPTGDTFYINIRNWSGTHGDSGVSLINSDLSSIDVTPSSGSNWLTDEVQAATPTINYRITDGAGDSTGTTIRFTAVNDNASGGIVINEAGTTITSSTGPMTDIEWLDLAGHTSSGDEAFIMGSSHTSALYASDDGTNWYTVENPSPDNVHISFADVTSSGNDIILIGRDIQGGKGGYVELDTADVAPTADDIWRVVSNTNTFADTNQYDSSPLPDVSITEFSKIGAYLYATTRSEGLWRLDDSTAGNAWTDE